MQAPASRDRDAHEWFAPHARLSRHRADPPQAALPGRGHPTLAARRPTGREDPHAVTAGVVAAGVVVSVVAVVLAGGFVLAMLIGAAVRAASDGDGAAVTGRD